MEYKVKQCNETSIIPRDSNRNIPKISSFTWNVEFLTEYQISSIVFKRLQENHWMFFNLPNLNKFNRRRSKKVSKENSLDHYWINCEITMIEFNIHGAWKKFHWYLKFPAKTKRHADISSDLTCFFWTNIKFLKNVCNEEATSETNYKLAQALVSLLKF